MDESRIGERVLVRNMLRSYVDYCPWECWTFGSECNGGFAQYAVAPSRETYAVNSDWSDEELAAVPCAYSTAELMLDRAGVDAEERVLITGASGGVGLSAVQLAKRRGAYVIALSGASKAQTVLQQGDDEVLDRTADLSKELAEPVHVVLDVVCGDGVNGLFAIRGVTTCPIPDTR